MPSGLLLLRPLPRCHVLECLTDIWTQRCASLSFCCACVLHLPFDNVLYLDQLIVRSVLFSLSSVWFVSGCNTWLLSCSGRPKKHMGNPCVVKILLSGFAVYSNVGMVCVGSCRALTSCLHSWVCSGHAPGTFLLWFTIVYQGYVLRNGWTPCCLCHDDGQV